MADGPVGVVRQRVHRLDRHHGPLEGAHAVEGEGHDEHAQDRIGAQLVPGAVQRHQAVDHAAPAGHPQHHREHHAERLRPIGQRGVVEVVRTRPDIQEDQCPEVDDRQLVGIDRAFGLLRHEVVHHAQEAGGEEEAHRVVAIPPLHHRALHAAEEAHRAAAEEADRNGQVVDEVEHRHRQQERQVEPVGHIDMRLAAPHQRGDENRQIGNPHHGEPDIDVPLGLGIFLALGDAHQIAGGGQHDEQLIAPEHEARERRESQPRPAGALHHIERGGDQRIAAKGEDDRRGVQRTQAPEVEIRREVQQRIGELKRNGEAHKKARHAPEHRGDDAPADHLVIIFARRWRAQHPATDFGVIGPADGEPQADQRRRRQDTHMYGKADVHGRNRGYDSNDRCREPQ